MCNLSEPKSKINNNPNSKCEIWNSLNSFLATLCCRATPVLATKISPRMAIKLKCLLTHLCVYYKHVPKSSQNESRISHLFNSYHPACVPRNRLFEPTHNLQCLRRFKPQNKSALGLIKFTEISQNLIWKSIRLMALVSPVYGI